jgi:tight adherence protein B
MRVLSAAGAAVWVVGIAFGLGVVGVGAALVARWMPAGGPAGPPRSGDGGGARAPGTSATHGPVRTRVRSGQAVAAVTAGCVAVALTGWPVAGLIAGTAAVGVPRLLQQMSAASSITTLEAIATWTELLQGTLAASAGLGQAIVATADLAPAPIRSATRQLSSQLQAGVEPRTALLRFADEIGDPSADRVVCALLLAFTERAQRLGDLLSALADSTREEVALRLRVETSRASVRSGVRTVVLFSVAFAGGLALLARSYLAPFGTTSGQAVLVTVGGLYAAGLGLMVTLARPPKPIRLLGAAVVDR